ncbi:13484_t:CDS:2, partial [Racocetra fulgida]
MEEENGTFCQILTKKIWRDSLMIWNDKQIGDALNEDEINKLFDQFLENSKHIIDKSRINETKKNIIIESCIKKSFTEQQFEELLTHILENNNLLYKESVDEYIESKFINKYKIIEIWYKAISSFFEKSVTTNEEVLEFFMQIFHDNNSLNSNELAYLINQLRTSEDRIKSDPINKDKMCEVLNKAFTIYLDELILNYQEGIKSVTQYILNEKSLNECDISFIINLFQEFENSLFICCYVDLKKLQEAAKNVLYKLPDIHELNTREKQSEFIRETILKDKSLSIYEKIHMSKLFKPHEEYIKVDEPDEINDKIRRCEICQNMTYASQYCEHCIRNYLQQHFNDWTSGNDQIDQIIQSCQLAAKSPSRIIEWIPYENIEKIQFFAKGGCASIYKGYWNQGSFGTWNAEKQILERNVFELAHHIILKKLENSSKTFIKELGDVITKHNRLQNGELRKLIASESSMRISLINKKSSSIYNFKKLPEPRNATA